MVAVTFVYKGGNREKVRSEVAAVEEIETPEEEKVLESNEPVAPVENTETISNESVEHKIDLLNDILNSGQENDPRLDAEFKVLDAKTKEAIIRFYDEWAPEGRNGRGTMVFLVGRNLNDKSDYDFLGRVLSEPQCLSLMDCNSAPESSFEDDQAPTEIALMYPQVVALESIRRVLDTDPAATQKFRADIELALVAGGKSGSPIIAERSQELLRLLNQ